MGFYEIYSEFKDNDFNRVFRDMTVQQVEKVIGENTINETGFLTLLSPAAGEMLEPMAQKAHHLTVRNFGRVISLYTPMYLSDFCTNECVYCGFNTINPMRRRTLTVAEVEREGRIIAGTGLRHLLILTGEAPRQASLEYLAECTGRLRKYFSSVSIEVYPMETAGYQVLVAAGVDGMTVYQEVYDPVIYDRLHIKGPKKNYRFRLDAPERACQSGMRTVNLGALLGLADWRSEVFTLGLHAKYLQDEYPDTEISVSFPRIRPAAGQFRPAVTVTDRELVQMILAIRLFLPRVGITISTRETSELRDNLIRLGVTKMSAGSCTEVGGRLDGDGHDGQFEISDTRSIAEMKAAIYKHGYQPVSKDWLII
ncbi:2-iminoacetate synthase ThiH [Phosphitispora sp. TUW77]|uniref:2-iminoacetate synthase ThiH n=1 Tax=Phosphitispora sp. TUW77 TaxID=3152361 RepID=UPI003AB5A8E7